MTVYGNKFETKENTIYLNNAQGGITHQHLNIFSKCLALFCFSQANVGHMDCAKSQQKLIGGNLALLQVVRDQIDERMCSVLC